MLTIIKILAKLWGVVLMGIAVYSGYKIVEFAFLTEHPSGIPSFAIVLCIVLALVDITVFFGGFALLIKKLGKKEK